MKNSSYFVFLTLLFLLLPAFCHAQKNIVKVIPLAIIPVDNGLSVHAYLGFERRLNYRNSLELGVGIAKGNVNIFASDGGSNSLLSGSLKYRYFFYLPDSQMRRAYYIGSIARYQYREDNCGAGCTGTTYNNIKGLGFLVGKNLSLGKRSLICFEIGGIVAQFHSRSLTGNLDENGMLLAPIQLSIENYVQPQLYAAFHWGWAW